MLLELIKIGEGKIAPANDETYDRIKKIKIGDSIMVEYKPRRNYQFHKKLFSLLKFVFDNQDHYKDLDNILEVVKFRSGKFDTIVTHTGKKHYKTKSIAFHAMDEAEFEEFYSRAIDVALELIPMDRTDLEKQILRYC